MRFHLVSTSRKSNLNRAIKSVVESLETRQLLSIVEGGQVAYYQNGAGQIVKINVEGGGALAFVGSSRDANGNSQLNDIPMTILDSTTGALIRTNLGGVAGRDGIAPISEITTKPPANPVDSLMRSTSFIGLNGFYTINGPTDGVAFEALATNQLGRTYAINRRTEGFGAADDNPAYDIVGVDNSNGRVQVLDSVAGKMLAALQAANPEFKVADLGDLVGADFDLVDSNTMYFLVNGQFPFSNGDTFDRKETPLYFSYNIRTGNVEFVNIFGARANDEFKIDDFTVLNDDQIAFFGSVKRGDNDPRIGLFITSKDRPGPDNFQPLTIGSGPDAEKVEKLAAIESIDGTFILAVDDRSASGQLLRIDLDATGAVIGTAVTGAVVDADIPANAPNKRGADIADLSFNPRLVDSNGFQIDKRGVLLGADATTDELVGLDVRQRFPSTDVFAIFDAESTTDTSLSMTVITPDSDQDLPFEVRLFRGVSSPFASSAGSIGTQMVDPGQDSPVLINLANGGVYIGGRSNDQDDQATVPTLSLNSSRDAQTGDYVGTLPGIKLPATVSAGIHIAGSMDRIFIGGTITGRVSIDGSVDSFYAGNVITGNPITGTGSITTDNFFVGGDLRNLFVLGGIGKLQGSPGNFDPGTDFAIGGRVMQIKSGLEFRGSLDVAGKTSNISNRDSVEELEWVVRATGNNVVNAFDQFLIANQAFNRNDSFDSPQILGSVSDSRGRGGSVSVDGTINNGPNFGDGVDMYGLPLLAGEGAVVQLFNPIITNNVQLKILDPSGRVYYTDQSNQNSTREDRVTQDSALSFNLPIKFTADKPGLWRIQIVATNPTLLVDEYRPYTLNVSQIGAISLGGLASTGSVVLSNPTLGVRVRTGDLGAILAGNELYGSELASLFSAGRDSEFSNPIIAQRGSIRTIEAASISHLANGVLSGYPFIKAGGKIGLIHADDRLYINRAELAVNISSNGKPSSNIVTGGDIQVVEAGGNFSGVLATNGSIGVIRAGSIDANTLGIARASYFMINADGKGSDELGLIDSAGDIGNFDEGGPSLFEGNGGNIRYIRADGQIYRDRFFGFGSTIVQRATNDSITVTDDSGAEVSVKPITGTFIADTTTGGTGGDTTGGGTGGDTTGGNSSGDPLFGPGPGNPFNGGTTGSSAGSFDPVDPFNHAGIDDPFETPPIITDPGTPTAGVPTGTTVLGALQLDTYPVRSGGFVITNVESTTGVTVATNREGGGGTADISRIRTGIAGAPLVVDANGDLVLQGGTVAEPNHLLDVILVGNSRVNVLEISGSATGDSGATYTRIDNFTDGEIINLNAKSVGVLIGEWIGVSRPVGGVKLEGLNNVNDGRFNGVANLYPFNNAKNMIFLSNASTVAARGPIGNVTVQERIDNLVANAGNKNVKGVLEGIVAPILVLTGSESIDGTIRTIDIGEGLAYSGSGETSFAGLYSTDRLGTITNLNGGGDLRGDVVVRNYVNRINLTGNGSIIDADIYATDVGVDGNALIDGPSPANGFEAALETVNIIPTISVINDTPTSPIGVGKITITGRGGMMNTRVLAYNIGKVTANGGSFGVLTSDFLSETGGTMGGISADGLGIRFVSYRGGSYTGDIIATGQGKLHSVDEYSRSVRSSESGGFDTSTGNGLNVANDLNLFLGTDKNTRSIEGVTNEGYIEDSLIEANRNIRLVKAFEIRVRLNPLNARPRDETYPMQINTGGELTRVTTQRNIAGLRVVAGTTGTIQSGYDIKNFQLQSTGFANEVIAKRNYAGSSNINLTGSGSLNLFAVGGNLAGTAYAARGFRTISVGGNLSSQRSQGGIYTSQSIGLLEVTGDVLSGTYVQAKNIIKSLVVRGDVQSGAQILAKSISNKSIAGEQDGVVS